MTRRTTKAEAMALASNGFVADPERAQAMTTYVDGWMPVGHTRRGARIETKKDAAGRWRYRLNGYSPSGFDVEAGQ